MDNAAIKKLYGGKKITLMGLGLLGRGVGDAEFFADAGAELLVTDLKSEADLAPSLERLKTFPNITYRLGEHRLEDFENRDLIIRAPNAPLDSPFLMHARELNIPIEMDASLFAKLTEATLVGVTGTRGKSTTTHLVAEILKAAGKNIFVGGNERDMATLPLLYKTKSGDIVVLELDSWQLQGFEENKISPHVSIWTNFMPDHMNYYKNDMDRYFRDKAAIARFQKKDDYFVTAPDIKEKIETRFGALQSTCVTDATIPADWELGLEGDHNRKNAAYARAVVRCLGVSDEIIKESLKKFHGLPGRLELLEEKNDIAFYNDSNSTTPEATMVALATLAAKQRPIILIAGGSDKELDFTKLVPEIKKTVKKIILFRGAATEKIQALLGSDFPSETVLNMDEALEKALAAAHAHDIILLSPAATSFGIFKNEYDRGDQFKALVQKLK
jgi:UDP-N-acetylmuramoylalanine--D-glutamate ligase